MTSLRQWLRSSTWFLLFVLLGMSLFWESCDQLGKGSSASGGSLDTLPDTVTYLGLEKMHKYDFEYGNLGPDFIFDTTHKATYFRLNDHQTTSFFAALENIIADSIHSNDTARIRVNLGLFRKKGSKEKGRPNLSLFVSIINNELDSVFYPLRVLPNKAPSSGFNWTKIPDKLADSLTTNWINIANKDINKQLYEGTDTSDTSKRIRYYTFKHADTKDMYAYRKKYPKCGFYLYLGVFDKEVPLRVIIRLTKNMYTRPSRLADDEGDDDNYEFSVQCPHQCN